MMNAIFSGVACDRGDDQVALVLAVVIVGDDDDLAGGERLDRLADTGLRHVRSSPQRPPGYGKAVGGEKSRVRQAQSGDGQPPQDSAGARRALRRILEGADAQLAGKATQQLRCTLTASPCSAPHPLAALGTLSRIAGEGGTRGAGWVRAAPR